jgi:uncharacterized membrane protein
MCPHSHSSAVSGPHDRAGEVSPSGGAGRRWSWVPSLHLKPTALKPVTYSVMHLLVAVSVAYALTRDWRIALGVGIIEPMVQTVAYVFHEKAWAMGTQRKAGP